MMNNSNTLTRDNALKDNNDLKEFYSARGFASSKVHKISSKIFEAKKLFNHPLKTQEKGFASPIPRIWTLEVQTVIPTPTSRFVFRVLKSPFDYSYSFDKIREYFVHKPSIRVEKRSEYTKYIQSTEDVFKVLLLGNNKEEFFDAYDGAVDLLAECDEEILTKAFDVAKKYHISDETDATARAWEKNWDILIQALTCSLTIEPIKKISLILSLYDGRNKLSRLIKLALIDAIVDIEIDEDFSESILNLFTSEKYESEEFIRQYANEAIESL